MALSRGESGGGRGELSGEGVAQPLTSGRLTFTNTP